MPEAETMYFVVAAAAATTIAYLLYMKDLVWGETSPNRWSWFIWTVSTAVEAMTYQEVSGDWMKSAIFYLSAFFCLLVTASIWLKGKWKWPSVSEFLCLAASVAALVLWLYYGEAGIAHWVAIGAVPIAFIPTWRGALKNPASEKSLAWPLWSLADFIVLLVIVTRLEHVDELPYATIEFFCHFLTWSLVRRRTQRA